VRGVPRRDHPQAAGGLGQRRRGLRFQHVPLERLLLLLQYLVFLAGIAKLVRTLGRVRGQPQCDAQPGAEGTDDQHHERHFGRQCAWP
jgi:hypothetical protein